MKHLCLAIFFNVSFFLSIAQQGPNSGATFSNITITGSTSTWLNMSNAASSNDVRATTNNLPNSGNYSDYMQATGFGFSIPGGAAIDGIVVEVERNDANGKTKDSRIRIVKNNTIGVTDKSVNSAWGATESYQTYGSSTDLWGETWTAGDINSANFGFAISVERTGGGAQPTQAQVDHIRITVYFTAILPSGVYDFTTTIQNRKAILNWKCDPGNSTDHFEVEKSYNGNVFQWVANINNSNTLQYNYQESLNQKIYYRIKHITRQQQVSYSQVLAIVPESENIQIQVYPNPATNEIHISGFTGRATARITDHEGRLVIHRQNLTQRDFISIQSLKTGIYQMQIQTSMGLETKSFVKN
jgi:hypothetical protein